MRARWSGAWLLGLAAAPLPAEEWTYLTVEVVGEDGAPLGSTRIDVVFIPAGTEVHDHTRVFKSKWREDHPYSLKSTVTHEEGTATIQMPADGTTVAVRAMKLGHPPVLQSGIVLKPGERKLRFVLPDGASLAGRFQPAAVLRVSRDLYLRRPSDGVLINPIVPTHPLEIVEQHRIQKDLRFAIDGLPEGEWEILWMFRPLARVMLVKGETVRVDLDARHLEPGQLQVQFHRYEGMPSVSHFELVHDVPGEEEYRGGGAQMTANGRVELRQVLAGSYRLVVFLNEPIHGASSLRHPELFEIRSGETTYVNVHLTPRRLHVRVVEKDGATPVRDTEFDAVGELCNLRVKTGADGTFTIFPIPSSSFDLRRPGSDRAIDTILLPPGKEDLELVIKLR